MAFLRGWILIADKRFLKEGEKKKEKGLQFDL